MLCYSQLLNHNEAAMEIQIEPRSISKQVLDTQVTVIVLPFLPPGRPTWEEKIIVKISKFKVRFSKPHQ